MKKLLLIAALAALSSPAFASKARVTALGNADHLVDTQTVFDNPAHLTLMGDYVTFEAGPTTATASTVTPGTTKYSDLMVANNPNAEGGFVRSSGDAKYMAYLGRRSPFTQTFRTMFGFLQQENTIELQYAMKGAINWGVGLNYSSSDKKSGDNATTVAQKQQAAGVRLGASADMWEGYAIIGLMSTAEGATAANVLTGDADGDDIVDGGEIAPIVLDATAKYKGTTGFKLGGAYKMENVRIFGKYYQDGFKYEGANTTYDGAELTQSQADVGAVEYNKLEGGQWFYGASFQLYNSKFSRTGSESKTTATFLPFLVGVEYDAASWLTLRASATQNVLLGSYKVEDAAAPDEANTIQQNTKVAAGLGLRFGKWVADGSWAAQTTGNVNSTNFLTNLGMTYMF
ncbi:MAG: hypothetical protein ACAH59_06910 [Pseudobdellovibrionaceae bacterium]